MRRLLDCFLLLSICLSTLSARYDKRKYQDEDFDDRSMENNKFSSIMMEEARWGSFNINMEFLYPIGT